MLVTLIVSIFSPFTAHIQISPITQVNFFVTLDVCHASGSFMSSNSDTPSFPEYPCKPATYEFVEFIEIHNPFFTPSLRYVQIERPPRI